MSGAKIVISLLIVGVMSVHALPILQELQGHRQTFWPIMVWGMYRQSYDSNRPITAKKKRTIGVTWRGKEVAIGSMNWFMLFNIFRRTQPDINKRVGLNRFGLERLYLKPLWTGENEAAQRLADWLNRNRKDPIVRFRLEGELLRLTHMGLVQTTLPSRTYVVAN